MNVTGLYGGSGTSTNGDIPSNPRYTRTNPKVSPSALVGNAGLIVSNRTASETRPINRTFTYWIKAYPAKVDTGSIDLANLTRDIQGVAASVSDAESRMQQNINANTIGGANQTWVNETANRRWGILYQNTTGHTIVLNVLFDPGSSTAPYSTIDIGQTADTPVRIAQGNIGANTVTIIVPNGWYYIARERTAALQRWMELK